MENHQEGENKNGEQSKGKKNMAIWGGDMHAVPVNRRQGPAC